MLFLRRACLPARIGQKKNTNTDDLLCENLCCIFADYVIKNNSLLRRTQKEISYGKIRSQTSFRRWISSDGNSSSDGRRIRTTVEGIGSCRFGHLAAHPRTGIGHTGSRQSKVSRLEGSRRFGFSKVLRNRFTAEESGAKRAEQPRMEFPAPTRHIGASWNGCTVAGWFDSADIGKRTHERNERSIDERDGRSSARLRQTQPPHGRASTRGRSASRQKYKRMSP